MAHYNGEWDDLGRNIQDIVDRAVNAHDYQKLNETIRQVVGRAVDLGGEAVRKAVDSTARPASQASSGEVKQGYVEKNNLPALYGRTNGKSAAGIAKVVGGGVLSCVTFAGFFANVMMDLIFGGPGRFSFAMGVALAGLAAGVWLVASGINALGKVKRFKTYRRTLGQKTYCALEKLARSVGKSERFVRRELQQMISEGLFPEGHLDREGNSLIISDETYQYYEQSRLQLEQRRQQEAAQQAQKAQEARQAAASAPTHDPRVQEVLDRGNAFIAQIRSCNDAIPGEEISAKIDRMELIVRRIFLRAEAHPEIVPDLKKLMDYYLPMTVKLLNAYADMDAQPIQGATIEGSKREIEDTLDTLNLAFEKLLDSVYKDTALDVSSDISVLQTLLAQEGLTEDDFTKLKNQPK